MLVIDVERVDPNRQLFRPAVCTDPKIIHRLLAKALTTAKLTGCDFIELKGFQSG